MDLTPALHVFKRRPFVSKKFLFGIILIGFALSVCQLLAFRTNPSSHILCFVDWKSLLQASLGFIRLGASLLRHSLCVAIRRYGKMRLFLSWLFILTTSYVLVTVVLDQTALWSWNKLELTLIKKLEENVVTINETRPEFLVRESRTYEPYKLEKHSRYNGEDIQLVCEDTLYFENKVRWHHQQVIWKHNLERIEPSDRYHIDTIFEELPNNETILKVSELLNIDLHIYHVVSKLEIYMIDGGDYGKYSCHIAQRAFRYNIDPKANESVSRPSPEEEPSEQMDECPKQPTEEMVECRCQDELYLERLRIRLSLFPYEWNAEFIVSQILPMKREVFVPIGSIISVSASYKHLDDTPVEFDHEINGKSFADTCESYEQTCSLFMYMYWFLWHNGGHYSSLPALYMSTRQPYMDNGIKGTSWQCACSQTYGTHRYIFYRKFFNSTMGTYQMISIQYPDLTEVKPQEPNILEPYFKSTKGPFLLPEPACWGDFKTTICVYFEHFLNRIATEFFFTEKQVFTISLISCIILALIFSKLTIKFITNPCINFILNRTIKYEPIENILGLRNENKDLCYDLFISCDEGQTLLADKIATHLKYHGLRVCLSDVDILGNELRTRGISRLVEQSRKYLIIVTPEYINNRLLSNFEFPLIFQRFHDGFVSNRHIALVELAPNLIPTVLAQFTIFNFSRTMDNDAMDCIRTWLGPSIFKSNVHSVKMKCASDHRLSTTYIYCIGLYFVCGMFTVFVSMFRGTLFN